MARGAVKDLFLEALKKICATENSPIRFPFNVSKVNDVMRGIKPTYHVSNTPFGRFVNIINEMEKEGHCVSDRQNDSVVFMDSKYALPLMRVPYTDEEKATLKKAKDISLALKRVEREKASLKEEDDNNGAPIQEDGDDGDESPSGEPIADGGEGVTEVKEVKEVKGNTSRSPSRSRSRSRSRDRRGRRGMD